MSEISKPTIGKVSGLIVVVGVLWGTTPYLERLALIQEPRMTTEYFQFWRGLIAACIVLICTLVMYRRDLRSVHKALTPRNFGFVLSCSVATVIYILCWLYVIRTKVMRVSVAYSITIGIAVMLSGILGYCWTFLKKPEYRSMGEKLRAENYVGIALVVIGVVLVGLDLRRLKPNSSAPPAMPSDAP